uniref:Major facilitator superfamily (MFS) profile domain-containing protein n=1 Tax=Schistocephalus solidus TaxID=70667 RepID=A0A0X3PI08_SCHSO
MAPMWGILSVVGGFLYHLSLGYYYTVGNMNSYVISYMQITPSQSAWFSSVIIAFQALSLPIGGIIAKKIGFRLVLILGIILSSGGILLTRLTVDYGLGAYVFTYCILFGLGMGLPYSVIFQVASSWFPDKRATVVGIIASGLGLGALVFTPIQTKLINPNDLQPKAGKYHKDVEERIPTAFLILGGIALTFQLIGLLLLRQRPDNTVKDEEVSIE